LESIHDHNRQRTGEGKTDMRILPLSFEFFELWIDRLLENPKRKYSIDDLISIFDLQEEYKNDLEIGKVFYRIIFKEDLEESELFERQLHRNTVHLGGMQVSARKRRLATSRPGIGLDFWMENFLFYSTRGWNRFSRTTGISLVQFEILNQINTRETWSISEISHHLEITAPAASQLVDKLVQSGLVYRSEDKRDRRARQLTLSPNGAQLVEKGRRGRHHWLDELAKSLSAEEKGKVVEALTILTKAAKEMGEEK
jgi:DNA-binding MarR family transcriptional regulator